MISALFSESRTVQAAQVCMFSAAQYFVPESSQFGLSGSFSMSAPFESRRVGEPSRRILSGAAAVHMLLA
jgi:hypothetical protein